MALLNPPASQLGPHHAIVSGRSRRRGHFTPAFAGPLSIKTVLRGAAVWRTGERVYRLEPGLGLILNAGSEYTLSIDAREPTETLCAFFRAGAAEDVRRCFADSATCLLDDPRKPQQPVRFLETLRPVPSGVRARLLQLRAAVADAADPLALDDGFAGLVAQLLDSEALLRRQAVRVPAARSSTREELLRRLLRARDFIEAELGSALTLERIADAACLSPFHCHRAFAGLFRETPHEYVTRRRLERAEALLGLGGRSVTDVSLDVGFQSLGSFSNLFKRRFGVSPAAYRGREKRKNR
jgi:AraC-like DNA-binding protein